MKKQKKFFITILVASFIIGIGGGVIGSVATRYFFEQTSIATVSTIAAPADTELSTVEAVERVSPAVVSVAIYKKAEMFSNRTGPDIFPFDDFFEFPFFNEAPQSDVPVPDADLRQVGGGSGFIISSDGMIVTNKHVASDDDASYRVTLQDGSEYDATILGKDPFNDLAVLKIDAHDLPSVTLGDSDSLSIGQTVIAIGNSLGEYQNTVTKGIISGINRRVVAGDSAVSEVIEEAIQTDAAINPGNSGGPLINLSGEVIGVNTAISRSGQLIGFAIPINTARTVVESVLEFGRIVRPWLGVRYVLNSPGYADAQNLAIETGGVLAKGDDGSSAIFEGSPAAKSGLRTGDIILKVDETEINDDNPLGKVIGTYRPGDTVVLTIYRDAKELTIAVLLEEYTN